MQVTPFAWLNAKIEKISTKDKLENYGGFLHNTIYVLYARLCLDTCVYHVIHQSNVILLLFIWSWWETAKLFKKKDLSNL